HDQGYDRWLDRHCHGLRGGDRSRPGADRHSLRDRRRALYRRRQARPLVAAAADQIADDHAETGGEDERGGEIVPDGFLRLIGGVRSGVARLPVTALGALAHAARQIVHIGTQIIELVVKIVDVEVLNVLDKLRGFLLGLVQTHHDTPPYDRTRPARLEV